MRLLVEVRDIILDLIGALSLFATVYGLLFIGYGLGY